MEFLELDNDLNHLPSSLEELTLSGFSSALHHLPPNISSLSLFTDSCPSFVHVSPSISLFMHSFDTKGFEEYPAALTHLKLSQIFSPFPPNLTHLYLDLYDEKHSFPHSLLYMKISKCTQLIDGAIPPFLTTLVLGYSFNQPLDHLPSSLKSLLILSTEFNKPIDHLPSSLTELCVGNAFNQNVDHLPSSLCKLVFGPHFNQPVNLLPFSLTDLTFGREFNHPIDFLSTNIQKHFFCFVFFVLFLIPLIFIIY